MILMAIGVAMLVSSSAIAGDYGRQWAQAQGLSDQEKQWFRQQVVPGGGAKGTSCCSAADGVYAEEDIRDGHYWTRFQYRKWDYAMSRDVEANSGWMPVPDEVIIPDNHHGAPVVWWWIPDGKQVKIRCYARGAGI